ncbi:MAG: hypothetical protein KF767_11615 [Bdellovibrionaceae bacterium]|nr:hypothetical protein [Pseudobdellovibrionaceae bacterium]
MRLEKLIQIALTAALIGAATGQLPRMVLAVRIAQLKLLEESRASKWPKAPLLPVRKQVNDRKRYTAVP